MLELTDQLPQFEANTQDGETINSKNYLGKKLVVFFYPKASTPTCTVEACNIRDHYSELQDKGFEILGVSADSVQRQKNFHSKNKFPFDLIADEDKELCQKFGVWKEKKTFGKTYMGIVRTTFVFDESGKLAHKIEKVDSKNAAKQILALY